MSAYLNLRKATAVKRIAAAAAAALACLIFAPQNAKADAMDWYSEGMTDCASKSFKDCSVCGAKLDCSGSDCTWGALTVPWTEVEMGGSSGAGFSLYCLGSGGVITPSGQAVGVQNISMNKAFTVMGKDKLGGKEPTKAPDGGSGQNAPDTIGAMAEYSGDTDGNSNAFGIVLPIGWTFFFGDDDLLDVNGNVIYSHLSKLNQFGFNANPIYLHSMYFDENNYRLTLGASLPLQLVGTFVKDGDNGLSWLVGAGFIGGFTRYLGAFSVGGGLAVDVRYGSGLQAPMLIAARGTYDLGFGKIVFQPGWSMELVAKDNIPDTFRGNIFAGYEFAGWGIGLQSYFQKKYFSIGFGVTYSGLISSVM